MPSNYDDSEGNEPREVHVIVGQGGDLLQKVIEALALDVGDFKSRNEQNYTKLLGSKPSCVMQTYYEWLIEEDRIIEIPRGFLVKNIRLHDGKLMLYCFGPVGIPGTQKLRMLLVPNGKELKYEDASQCFYFDTVLIGNEPLHIFLGSDTNGEQYDEELAEAARNAQH